MNVKQRPRTRHNLDLVNFKFCIAVELWPLVRQLREALKVEKIKGWKFPTKCLTSQPTNIPRLEICNLFSTLVAYH